MKYETLVCTLCRNHDDRKPAGVFAGEICICCNKGRLVVEEETWEGPTSAVVVALPAKK